MDERQEEGRREGARRDEEVRRDNAPRENVRREDVRRKDVRCEGVRREDARQARRCTAGTCATMRGLALRGRPRGMTDGATVLVIGTVAAAAPFSAPLPLRGGVDIDLGVLVLVLVLLGLFWAGCWLAGCLVILVTVVDYFTENPGGYGPRLQGGCIKTPCTTGYIWG